VIAFVTVPKPFSGLSDTIQRNAIASWLRVAPDVTVLLAGDEPGVAQAAESLGVAHQAAIPRTEAGTPRVDGAFALAVQRAEGRLPCFVNADILLPPSLAQAAEAARRRSDRFLVVGECWNARVDRLLDPGSLDWAALLRGARKRGPDALDYFLFSPGVLTDIPAFAIGRTSWDNWLVWKARAEGALVVDATSVVKAIHQDHDYGHVGSLAKRRVGPEAEENTRLAGGRAHLYSRYDATHRLTRHGLVPNPFALGHAGETVRRGWAKLGYRTGLRTS
jgi:hypothetical protein